METLNKINSKVSQYSGLYLLGIFIFVFFNTCGSFFGKSNQTYTQEEITKIAAQVDEINQRSCQFVTKDDLKRMSVNMLLSEKSLDKNNLNEDVVKDLFMFPSNCE